MIEIKKLYMDKNEAAAFVMQCEESFEKHLSAICRDIASDDSVKCVTLAGPTCSGKTTTAAKLTGELEKAGKRARVVSIDDFYYEKTEMVKRGVKDFEGPDAIDLDYFRKAVAAISAGESVLLPTFEFSTGKRIAYTEYKPHKSDIYIFEGIQAIYPEITGVLSDFGYKSLFISVADGVSVAKCVFDKNEIRLIRRMVRDFFHRGSSPEYTMSLWNSVRLNEELNIFPHISGGSIVINSMLPYEIFLIGKYFLNLTENYPLGAVHAERIMSLRQRLSALTSSAVDISMVPESSVIREFIT